MRSDGLGLPDYVLNRIRYLGAPCAICTLRHPWISWYATCPQYRRARARSRRPARRPPGARGRGCSPRSIMPILTREGRGNFRAPLGRKRPNGNAGRPGSVGMAPIHMNRTRNSRRAGASAECRSRDNRRRIGRHPPAFAQPLGGRIADRSGWTPGSSGQSSPSDKLRPYRRRWQLAIVSFPAHFEAGRWPIIKIWIQKVVDFWTQIVLYTFQPRS